MALVTASAPYASLFLLHDSSFGPSDKSSPGQEQQRSWQRRWEPAEGNWSAERLTRSVAGWFPGACDDLQGTDWAPPRGGDEGTVMATVWTFQYMTVRTTSWNKMILVSAPITMLKEVYFLWLLVVIKRWDKAEGTFLLPSFYRGLVLSIVGIYFCYILSSLLGSCQIGFG